MTQPEIAVNLTELCNLHPETGVVEFKEAKSGISASRLVYDLQQH